MNQLRRALGALLSAVLLSCGPVRATSFTTDQSDIYNAVGESGWAAEFVQRGSTIFAVIYVYDQGTNPFWYSATLEFAGSGPGALSWSGDLYATKGPWFGTIPFNSSQVTLRKVGTMTWTAQSVTGGTLTYSVDGVSVTKNIQRVLIRYDDFSGHYGGGSHDTFIGCANPAFNGTTESAGLVYVTQNGQAVSFQVIGLNSPGSCSYSGTMTQAGQMGSVTGNFSCSDGSLGTFTIFEVQVNPSGITARTARSFTSPAGCKSTGWFGGARGTTF
jgi:hypothetical protein